ncbi:GNAT family N-acetyltransferase [Microbispora sp. H13382]|uniref:GNAT family N-acetyltransferase n=1 Tax=Microbispora sp. H13382 TaxID=2729112 RepID=UPI0015FEBAFD|nr:GNAT family N-acetyltransferase [Microbispora sp. H13382]
MLGTQVGSAVDIRAARPDDDEERVRLFLGSLSRATLTNRFFVGLGRPSERLVRAMVARDDRRDALLALHGDAVIGHAMSHLADGAYGVEAEIGVVVDDRWQNLGVGSRLVRTLLRRASVRGAVVVGMDVMTENRRVLAMVRRTWPSATIDTQGTSVEIKARLAFAEQGSVGSPLTM